MENSNKKLFAFDLDGTLLNSEQKLSKENIAALELAQSKGHILVITTGRNYIYSQFCLKESWGFFNYFAGCNGAIIHSINNRNLINPYRNKIDFSFVEQIINEIKDSSSTIQVSTEWEVFTDEWIKEGIQVISPKSKERFIDPFPSISAMTEDDKKSIVQISVHVEQFEIRKTRDAWEEKYPDYEFTITSPNNIDINWKNINKLSAIKEICKLENIEYENVFVFGDSQNDIKGLNYYNNTYAMENALPEVKKIAKNIIGNNDSDAIAKVIIKNVNP